MDDLLDLDWSSSSSAAAAPALKPQSLKPTPGGGGSKTAPSTSSAGSFDFLSAPLRPTSASSSRSAPLEGLKAVSAARSGQLPANSLGGPSRPASGTATPVVNSARTPAAASGHATPSSLNDAFSGLLSLDGSAVGASSRNMTMAQRQQAMEEEKRRNEEKERAMWGNGDFWAKHAMGSSGGLAAPASAAPSTFAGPVSGATRAKSPLAGGLDDLLKPVMAPARPCSSTSSRNGIMSPAAVSATASDSATKKLGSLWDNPDFLSATTAQPSSSAGGPRSSTPMSSQTARPSPQPPADPFDFDALEAVPGPSQAPSASRTRNGRTSPAAHETIDSDEDDLLGQLGRPVRRSPVGVKSTTDQRDLEGRGDAVPKCSSSPPPHILGQIVEMGFSPAQARAALAKTSDGLDVQAALELLLNGGGSSDQGGSNDFRNRDHDGRGGGSDPSDGDDDDRVEAAWREREAARERQRARRAGPSRDAVRPRPREEREWGDAVDRENSGGSRADIDYQAQADKVLAQATEMGQNIMFKASTFWAAGKEKAMKVYEEQKKAREAGGSRPRPANDGRPRWMIEAEEADRADRVGTSSEMPGEGSGAGNGFKDDDSPPRPKNAARLRSATEETPDAQGRGTSAPKSKATSEYLSPAQRADLLFNDEVPVYKPANRHCKPVAVPSAAASAAPRVPTPRPASPAPLKTRPLISASPAQVQAAAAARAKGNEHFKLGRFPEAETAYSSAAAQLPDAHLLLIPVLNNRATARLKLGQSDEAAGDCTAVIHAIGLSYHPAKETPLPSEYAEVKLGNALVKALIKRAQAYEMGEKWQKALEDWERLMALDPVLMGSSAASTRNLAAEGARRARKMLEPPAAAAPAAGSSASSAIHNGGNTRAADRPAASVRPARPANPDRSAAVGELRKAAAAQDAEDAQRLALKDSVDARLIAWKGGKETNLRALIASLDMVLWEEMIKAGGLKVGMHELITEKQVKIRYMKVIARLHPDKLNVDNTTVEQRMLANGAFSALSDAWQAFSNA